MLNRTATVIPDTEVDLLRAQLAFELEQRAKAVRLALASTRSIRGVKLIHVSTGLKVPGGIRHLSSLVPSVPPPP